MNSEEARAELSKVCYEIGCSGVNCSCPGDPNCQILRKIFTVPDRRENDDD